MKKLSILIAVLFSLSLINNNACAQVTVGVSIRVAPPAMPVYTQPACPVEGYLWSPGYWAYDPIGGYYWVPGVWVRPPHPHLLWTPGYWGYVGGIYGWNAGYWGPHVGYYGGINYGYGYGGSGFYGGEWRGGVYHYNTAVSTVNNTVVHNTYVNNTVVNAGTNSSNVVNHSSFNGQGGVSAQPTEAEHAAMNEQHIQPTGEQVSHQQVASQDKNQFANVNHGKPATTAMNSPNGQRFGSEGHSAPNSSANHAEHMNNNHPQEGNANHPQPNHNQPQHNAPRSAPHAAPQHSGGGHERH